MRCLVYRILQCPVLFSVCLQFFTRARAGLDVFATSQKKAEDAVKVIVEIKEEVEKVRLALKEEEKRRIETMKALKSVRRFSHPPIRFVSLQTFGVTRGPWWWRL
jgi:hypothetical protein